MFNLTSLTLSFAAGAGLGALFFGGLWWTLRYRLLARNAALWILISAQLRGVMAVGGFYLIGRDDWHRLVAALAGFIALRMLIALAQSREQPQLVAFSDHPPHAINTRRSD